MKCLGGKTRVAKHILPIMLEARGDRPWVEPFVGGANMIDKVDGRRIGNDIHPYLIALLRAVQEGWVPPTRISQEEYYAIKKAPQKYPNELVGFVGFLCSFAGGWFQGYARGNDLIRRNTSPTIDSKKTNYAERGSRVLVKQAEKFVGIDFRCGDYFKMEIPPHSLIYCDPPYVGKKQYKNRIDQEQFWDWCREKKAEGHLVYVSEHSAPDDFECIKAVQHETRVRQQGERIATIEKLFIPKTEK